ncbi:hypothetical protein HDU96_002729 [Phlyctochytrium bullatum]|nr:hypothetical protein HDU96_002729 [Phlyctochytrium bullatum]
MLLLLLLATTSGLVSWTSFRAANLTTPAPSLRLLPLAGTPASPAAAPAPPTSDDDPTAVCPLPPTCPRTLHPVCASNNITFANLCHLLACHPTRTVRPVSLGACPHVAATAESRCTLPCTDADDPATPVCANDGTTFSSACALRLEACRRRVWFEGAVEELVKVADGPCPAPSPVVSEQATRTQHALQHPCHALRPCPLQPPDPVCGEDGVTYIHPCTLAVASCLAGTPIAPLHRGPCAPTRPPPPQPPRLPPKTPCTPDACDPSHNDPVCASDARTYANPCLLRVAACRKPGLLKVANGPCPAAPQPTLVGCERACVAGPEDRPVCGSDGRMYPTVCHLRAAACVKPGILRVAEGACPTLTLPATREVATATAVVPVEMTTAVVAVAVETTAVAVPECVMEAAKGCVGAPGPAVCGSDGASYRNACHLKAAAVVCGKPGLLRVSEGACGAATETETVRVPSVTVVRRRGETEVRERRRRERWMVVVWRAMGMGLMVM